MLLKDIFNGSLISDVIIVKDYECASGFYLLKEFIHNHLLRNNVIHFFAYENNEHLFSNEFITSTEKIYFYKSFWDLFLYKEKTDDASPKSVEMVLEDLLKENITHFQQVVIIDNAYYPILLNGIHQISQLISKLRSVKYKSGIPVYQVILMVHSNQIEEGNYKHLEHFASTVITINENQIPDELHISVLYKKQTGKRIIKDYICWLEEDLKFMYKEKKETTDKKVEEEVKPKELTTFKISLEDREKESRNKLVLPYMKQIKNPTGGKIFYEPDANDDWDDEDPDDDLEI